MYQDVGFQGFEVGPKLAKLLPAAIWNHHFRRFEVNLAPEMLHLTTMSKGIVFLIGVTQLAACAVLY